MDKQQILILGINPISETLIETLNRYGHHLTIIDDDLNRSNHLRSRYDINIISTPPCYPKTLESAHLENTKALIALTESDETNFVACHIAHSIHPITSTVACFKQEQYLWSTPKPKYATPITRALAKNQSVFEDIELLITHPGFYHINELSEQYVCASIEIDDQHPYYNQTLDSIKSKLPPEIIMSGLFRNKQWVKYRKNIKLSNGDFLLLLLHKNELAQLNTNQPKIKNILILGISDITETLCAHFQHTHSITVVDEHKERCQSFATQHPTINIIHDDPQDGSLLQDLGTQKSLTIAASEDDENNLVYSYQAYDKGSLKVYMVINNIRHGHIFETGPIDYAINKPQIIADHILRDLLSTKLITHFYTKPNFLQMAEIVITKKHPYCDQTIQDIKLPKTVYIGGIIRNQKLIFTSADTPIKNEDIIVIYSQHKKSSDNPIEHILINPNVI